MCNFISFHILTCLCTFLKNKKRSLIRFYKNDAACNCVTQIKILNNIVLNNFLGVYKLL